MNLKRLTVTILEKNKPYGQKEGRTEASPLTVQKSVSLRPTTPPPKPPTPFRSSQVRPIPIHQKCTTTYCYTPPFKTKLNTVVTVTLGLRTTQMYRYCLRFNIISLKLSIPDCKFSMISSASTSGSGRLSRSVRLLSFIQVMSKLVLSRSTISA